MRFLNALEQARWHILSLWCALGLSATLNIALILGWHFSESAIKVYIPPQIPESGLTMQQGTIPKSTIYNFAFYTWQSLNHWPKNGLKDYKSQINQFASSLTPTFKLKLIDDYNNLLNQGELQDRIRIMQGISGSSYSPNDVKYIGHGTWLVRLNMRLTEMMSMNAKVVKDVQMQYILKVVRYDVDPKTNPSGLAIAGFARTPKRIKTIV